MPNKKNDHFANRLKFARCLSHSLACTTLFPIDLGCPLHMLHLYVATFHCPKRIFVQEVGKHLKQTERLEFQLFNDKRDVFQHICTHAHKEDITLSDLKSTSILNMSALLLFVISNAFTHSLVEPVPNLKAKNEG